MMLRRDQSGPPPGPYPNQPNQQPDPPKRFDLIEAQALARDCLSAPTLYKQWDDICRLYERKMITFSEFDEMKDIIMTKLQKLKKLKDLL